jgi:hypothetical protein
MIISDINEDNNEDIIIANTRGRHIKIFLNSANGELTNENIYPTDNPIGSIVTGDMNNDGKIDILYRQLSG